MSSSRTAKQYARSTDGLRDALFDEMEDLRVGASHPQEALAFASLAGRVIESCDLDLRREAANERAEQRALRNRELAAREKELLALPAPQEGDDVDFDEE